MSENGNFYPVVIRLDQGVRTRLVKRQEYSTKEEARQAAEELCSDGDIPAYTAKDKAESALASGKLGIGIY